MCTSTYYFHNYDIPNISVHRTQNNTRTNFTTILERQIEARGNSFPSYLSVSIQTRIVQQQFSLLRHVVTRGQPMKQGASPAPHGIPPKIARPIRPSGTTLQQQDSECTLTFRAMFRRDDKK